MQAALPRMGLWKPSATMVKHAYKHTYKADSNLPLHVQAAPSAHGLLRSERHNGQPHTHTQIDPNLHLHMQAAPSAHGLLGAERHHGQPGQAACATEKVILHHIHGSSSAALQAARQIWPPHPTGADANAVGRGQ
eukprot:scaffold160810_cov20-Tisochrysis_lutea.AAC.3